MANTLDPLKAEARSSVLQEVLYENFIGRLITNNKFETEFMSGNDTVHFPRLAQITTLPLATSYTAVTLQDVTTTDETMVLSERTHFAIEISNEDYVEMKINPTNRIIQDGAYAFARDYDTLIMSEFANAGYVIDDGNMTIATNGGAGNPIILSNTNIYDMITAIEEQMNLANMPQQNRFLVISPKEKRLFLRAPEFIPATVIGDTLIASAKLGTYNGLDIILSNNINEFAGERNLIAGAGSPICFAANVKPLVEITASVNNPTKFVTTMKAMTKFGVKTFFEGANRLIHIPVVA